jgi:hypothetical protein
MVLKTIRNSIRMYVVPPRLRLNELNV